MKNKIINIIIIIVIFAIVIGLAIGGFFLVNTIINSDLSNWWKWILLK